LERIKELTLFKIIACRFENRQAFLKMNNSLKGKRILVVEDQEMNWFLIRDILENYDVETTWAEVGQKAIDLINSGHSFDAILMDINLPLVDGYEITRQIKEINPKITIIAQTAYAVAEEIRLCYKAGCSAHICKPFSVFELASCIATALNIEL
jgi:two-component system, cell cycle response regulator DivK